MSGSGTVSLCGVIAFTSNSVACKGSEYKMYSPLGDQSGLYEGESTRRTGAPPSTGTRNNRDLSFSLAATATHFPSGDQEAALRISNDGASGRMLLPSELMMYMPPRPLLRKGKQIWEPSGEIAAGATAPPSLPFHSSVATSFCMRQIPSAPPCEERKSKPPAATRGACARAFGAG